MVLTLAGASTARPGPGTLAAMPALPGLSWRLRLLAVVCTAALAACGAASEAELVASARSLMARQDHKGAVIQLKNALQKSPDSAEIRLMLGRSLLAGGDPASALVELRKALELQAAADDAVPMLAQAMLMVGEEDKLVTQFADLPLKDPTAAADLATALAGAYGVQRKLPQALARAEAALVAKPDHVPALIMLARLRAANGEEDAAMALLDRVRTADAANEPAGILTSELLLRRKGDPEGALVALRQVLGGHPESTAARAAVANVLFQQRKLPEARAEFEELNKTAPNHPETMYIAALLAFADDDDKRTREITEQLLRRNPDNVRVLELAGATEFRSQGYLQAEALLSRALKLAPQQRLARLTLAQTYLRVGEPAKTVELLKPVVDSGAADGAALALTGQAYLQLGDQARSTAAFDRALKLAPGDPRVRTSAAVARLARGDRPGAISELEAVAQGDSGTRADLALVSARMQQGDRAGALRAVDALEKKMPKQALPHQLRGRLLASAEDTAGARRSFETATAVEPTYFPPVASLAALDLAAGQPAAARDRFKAHLKANPRSWQAQLALAELEARTGAPTVTVTAALREAVKVNPSETRPHLMLVGQLLSANDAKGALLAAQEAGAALPNNTEVMEALGRAELAAGDHQRAISTLKRLASLQPRNATPEMRLAEAHAAAGDRRSAERSLRRAIELQPDLTSARRGLAQLAVLDQRPADALAIARDMQKTRPKDAAGFVLEGDIETTAGRWDAAIAAYRSALQRNVSSAVAIQLHRSLAAATTRTAEAERMAADWLQSHPKDSAFLHHLGDVALAGGQWAAAEARYRAVLEVRPDNAVAMNNVAWLLLQQGKPGALAVAERANALLPERAPLLDTLSIALEAENQLPRAVDVQKRAVEREPGNASMSLRLAKLYIKSGDKARARTELESLDKLGEKSGAQAEVAQLLKTL